MSEHEQITLGMYSTLTAQQLERIQELEQRNRELTRQVEQLFDREVQLAPIEYGPEPSLRKIIFAYYAVSGMKHSKAERYTRDLITALTAPPSSSDRGRNDSKAIEGDTGRDER